MRIEDGEGTEISSLEGRIWITQEGDQRDVVLSPGKSFTLDRNGLTLLVALDEPAVARVVGKAARRTYAALASVGVLRGTPCSETFAPRQIQARGSIAA